MSIATINQCINFRNRHNNGPDRLMPRAIFVQQHGLAKSKSDISDSILLSFACNSQPLTFLSCDRQEEMSQLFNITGLKSISLSLFFFVCFSNAIDPLCRWHCFLKIIDRVVSNAAGDVIHRIYTQHFKSSSLWEIFSSSKKLSTSDLNASSEVTKEELYQFFYLGNKINMWRN